MLDSLGPVREKARGEEELSKSFELMMSIGAQAPPIAVPGAASMSMQHQPVMQQPVQKTSLSFHRQAARMGSSGIPNMAKPLGPPPGLSFPQKGFGHHSVGYAPPEIAKTSDIFQQQMFSVPQ